MTPMFVQAPLAADFNVLQRLQSGFTQFVNYLPQLLGAILILVIGYVIAKVLNKIVTKLLQRIRLDERLADNQGGKYAEKVSPGGKPSRLVGGVLFWVIMLFVISSAISTLAIPALTGFMNTVLRYLPNVIAALLIFLVAGAVAGAVAALVRRTMGDTPTGKVVHTAAPALIMAIALFMILTQLRIAPVIVTVTYIALVGALALAAALAFGLGGRDAAAELVNSGYRKAQGQADPVKQDLATGRRRAQQEVGDAQRQLAESGQRTGMSTQPSTGDLDGPAPRGPGAHRGG